MVLLDPMLKGPFRIVRLNGPDGFRTFSVVHCDGSAWTNTIGGWDWAEALCKNLNDAWREGHAVGMESADKRDGVNHG